MPSSSRATACGKAARFAAFGFALAVQPLYEASLRGSPGFSIQDDFTVVGPTQQVMKAYDYLKLHAQAELGLELVTAKCQVFLPPTLSAGQLPAVQALCIARSLSHSTKMESLGVMFGPAAEVSSHCETAVDASRHFFECITHPAMPVQTAALLLRYCAVPRLGYLARTTHPELLLKPSQRFDAMAMRAQLAILQQSDESLRALEPRVRDPDSSVLDPGDGDPPPGSQPLLETCSLARLTHTADSTIAVSSKGAIAPMALHSSLLRHLYAVAVEAAAEFCPT